MFRQLLLPAKYRYIEKYIGNRPFSLLDIGAGNHSASKTKKWYPEAVYHGVDLDKTYNNDENDLRQMHAFYEMNLEDLQFDVIPENHFDFIMCAHVIEHLKNGDQVLEKLLSKIKPGGYLYVEFPGYRSTQLPSMYGTLNFFDDHTHVRIYSVRELMNLFMRHGMKVMAGGTRRHVPTMLLMPLKIFHNLMVYKKVLASILWDYFGFAEFALIQKPAGKVTTGERQTIKY